jgi:hypothetical protein
MGWYSASWPYRVAITVDNTKVDADLTDFTVYVDLANLPAGFHANVNQTDGRDIRVTKADGTTELPREVVYYDAATDTGSIHFKADALANLTDTVFYIYYGNASATEPAAGATYGKNNAYDGNYKGVWHLQDNAASTSVADSTSTGANGTAAANTSTKSTTGKMGRALTFNGTSDKIAMGSNVGSYVTADSFTLSAWVNISGSGERAIYGNAFASPGYLLRVTSAGRIRFILTDGANYSGRDSSVLSAGWHHILAVWSGSGTPSIYVDGVLDNAVTVSSGTLGAIATSAVSTIGATPEAGNLSYFNGTIDEVRTAKAARSVNWATAEYRNQNSPSTFYAVGAAESMPASSYAGGLLGFM